MDKHPRLTFLGLLKVSLLGVAFPLLLTSHNWARANIKQDNSLLYAQTPGQSTPQPTKSGEIKKTNSPPQEKKQEEEEKSDEEKKQDLPWFVPPIGLGVLVVLYGGVLWFRPLWLLWLPAELKIPKMGMLPEFNLPLGFVIWLKYRPRVLDAWIKKHIDTWRKEFNKYETVSRRENYVSLTIDLLDTNKKDSNKQQQKLIAKDLRKFFKKDKRLRILIWGDGGTGKTTIACQIAKWAMAEDKEERLTEHSMLPVLIEQEPKSPSDKDSERQKSLSDEGTESLIKDIMRKIQDLTNTQHQIVDELLIKQLLRQHRILLIWDRFSEMNIDTRQKIDPTQSDFPANVFVVTSRKEENGIGQIDIKIKTIPLDGVDFTNFIKSYLKTSDEWKLFEKNQDNFLKECAQLVVTFGSKKSIIPLFAKFHADRMVNVQKNLSITERFPDNIPDLIIEDLKTLNSDVERSIDNQEFHTWEENAKLIAWKCLEEKYQPNYVDRKSIADALGGEKGEKILTYFHEKLHLIKPGESETIKFVFDTVAEYLAGLYLVEFYKEDKEKWDTFLKTIDSDPDKNQEIKGFLLAVRECCITKGGKEIHSYVADKLGELAGLDLKAEKQEKQKQRIDRFISDLSDSELGQQSKEAAIQELQNMARKDQYALEALLTTLKINDVIVCGGVAKALGNLGNSSRKVLDGLLARLEDKDESVRTNVVVALGKLVSKLETVPNNLLQKLLINLQNMDQYVLHYHIVQALGNLRNPFDRVLTELLLCLQNKDYSNDVHQAAAEALGKLGNASHQVINGLLECLKDKDYEPNVHQAAAEALGKLGNISEPVLNALLARLQDKNEDFNVRQATAEALGKLGNASEQLVDRLLALVLDRDEYLHYNAIQPLRYLGNTSRLIVVDKLLVRLQDKNDDVDVRSKAATALGMLDIASESVLDGLLARLQDKNDNFDVRSKVPLALTILGNASKSVLDGLLASLQDKEDHILIRRFTAEALGKLGNASKSVLDGLLASLQDKEDHILIRCFAAEALGKLGNASKEIIDELSARSKDTNENSEVRDAATKTLEVLTKSNNPSENI